MLYEIITKILNKSKTEDIDVFVARDRLVVGVSDDERKEIMKASDVLDTYYKTITSLRKSGSEGAIRRICDYVEAGDTKAAEAFIEDLVL